MTKDELKALRAKLGLTQEQMGDRLGISRDAVYSLECGRNNMSRPVEMLANLLANPPQDQLREAQAVQAQV